MTVFFYGRADHMSVRPSLNILIADDSKAVHVFFVKLFEKLAIDAIIHHAKDGPSAIEKFAELEFDIAFIDIYMPHLSGLDALKLMRSEGHQSLVVLMSSTVDQRLLEIAKELKIYDFLKKPFNEGDICRILRVFDDLSTAKSVLIADDSATVRKIIRKVLERSIFNLDIAEAADGSQALAHILSKRPDVTFMDYYMPKLNGLEATRRLSATNPDHKTILISSKSVDEVQEECANAGLFAFMKKPFFSNEVDFVLHRLYGLNIPESLAQTPNVRFFDELEPVEAATPEPDDEAPDSDDTEPASGDIGRISGRRKKTLVR